MTMFDFPASPVDGEIYAPPGGPRYQWLAPVWNAVGSVLEQAEQDAYWPTRDALVASVAAGMTIFDGKLYTAGGFQYVGTPGATAIPDLPGLVPMGANVPEDTLPVATVGWAQLFVEAGALKVMLGDGTVLTVTTTP